MRLSSGGWSLLACTLQGPHQAAPGRARWSRGRSGPRAYVAFKPTALWLHVRLLCGYMPDCSDARRSYYLSSMSFAQLTRECREVSRHIIRPAGCFGGAVLERAEQRHAARVHSERRYSDRVSRGARVVSPVRVKV
jgi:hypothetical protein